MTASNIRYALLASSALMLAAAPAHAQYRGDFTSIDVTKGGITCRPGASCDISTMRVVPAGGGIARALSALFSNEIYAADYGVTANDGKDDTLALQTAINVTQTSKGRLILPGGTINVCDTSDPEALVRITSIMELQGAGRGTRIEPCPAAGNRSVILVKPLVAAGGIRGLIMRDFAIGELGTTRAGGDGIRFDTTNLNGFIAKPLVENVGIADAGAGKYAIHHINNPNAATGNYNGGLFGGTFQNSDLWGGVKFYKTGDSNNILRNIMTGSNPGIEYEGIEGAATHVIEGNNITSTAGGIIVRNTIQAKIVRNQTESYHPQTGPDGALIVLDGTHDSEVRENNANAYDRVDVVSLKNGSSGNTVADNVVTYGSATGKVLARLVNAPNNTIGRQRSDNDCLRQPPLAGQSEDRLTFTPRVRHLLSINAGSYPTLGAFQPLTLDASWLPGSDPAFYQGLAVSLKPDGDVIFRGTIASSATQSPGAPVTTLPQAYRPAKAIRIGADMLIPGSPSTWGRAIFIVDETGGVFVQSAPNTTLIQFDSTTFSRF
ncbi:hypothetical protein E4V01_20455 [Methylorubrum sp. Q1]|uniref:hypothetical protein n=1 Tax=Methylorubrum sp. Q1 TaxID=2562453 RepID=UPI0010761D82|nr:hypothetical protein [Methylorubrum sp. Q1]TFZ55892.1 hypothetical protein E4V01_20455 [Methylorubrum sp. Q1]